MFKKKYLIRLDDASPFMDKKRWDKIETILDQYSIKPLVGIIPHNEDINTIKEDENFQFWDKVIEWQEKKWSIALHGFNHCYLTNCGGINPIHSRSEFAGLSYEDQLNKIQKGYGILKQKRINPHFFFAPSHTYDENTIQVLRDITPIRIISDTIGRYPYTFKDFTFVPCQFGKFRNILIPGYWTFCFHPNNMDDDAINEFRLFIDKNKNKFMSFDEICIKTFNKKSIIDRFISCLYFIHRKYKRK